MAFFPVMASTMNFRLSRLLWATGRITAPSQDGDGEERLHSQERSGEKESPESAPSTFLQPQARRSPLDLITGTIHAPFMPSFLLPQLRD